MSLLQLNPLRLPLILVNWYRWFYFHPPQTERLEDADVLVALTFGIGPNGTPGIANKQIAQALGNLRQTVLKPIIAQKEVYDALVAQNQVGMENVHRICGPNEDRSEYLHHHSSDSVQDVLTVCQHKGWKRIALIGQAKHMPRVTWCFQHEGMEVLHVETTGIEYCRNSTQRWCRGSAIFTAWELILAIPAYTLLGKI